MFVQVEPVSGHNPGIHIYGKHVTEIVHQVFAISINANHRDDPWYHARQKAGAFFQGGSDKPKGEWVFIEFWKPETADTYVDMINQVLKFVDDQGQPKELTFKINDCEKYARLQGLLSFYETTWVKVGIDTLTFTPNHGGLLMRLHELDIKPLLKPTLAQKFIESALFNNVRPYVEWLGPVFHGKRVPVDLNDGEQGITFSIDQGESLTQWLSWKVHGFDQTYVIRAQVAGYDILELDFIAEAEYDLNTGMKVVTLVLQDMHDQLMTYAKDNGWAEAVNIHLY